MDLPAAIDAATRLIGAGRDPLAAAAALRADGLPPDLAAAALTQATLRQRAAAKFGDDAGRLRFTRAGLEQATRKVVADRRAARLAAAGVRRIADLGCGIGADAIAFARAGIRVLAVEADPETAAVARFNLAALGLAGDVVCGDATAADLSDVDAVFCDPARRSNGRRVFDPAAFSPPWSFVVSLPGRVPSTVLKLAPGLDHALIPAGAEAEWVSVDGDLVEATVWCGPLAGVPRRATVIRDGASALTGAGEDAPVGPIGRFVYDPDAAVVRSHLVGAFASTVDGRLADPRIAYVFADTGAATPFAAAIEVVARLPYPVKQLRAALREHDIGRLEIRKRGLNIDPDRLRRELRLAGRGSGTLVLTRLDETPVALLGRPVPG
jgi:SAM-dependent methyltransferase